MEWLAQLLGRRKEATRKTLADYQREAHIREAAKQFELLIERGLQVPIAHL